MENLTTCPILKNPAPAGAIGVCMSDNRQPPRMFKLLDIPTHMGVGYFEPLNDKGATVAFPIRDFWALIDYLP